LFQLGIEWVVTLVEVETVVEIDIQDSAESQSQKRQDSEDSVDSVQDSTESWLLIVPTSRFLRAYIILILTYY